MADRLVIFLHVPKTGGVTMRRILDRQYKKNRIYRYAPDRPLSPIGNPKLQCVYGHCRYGIHRHSPKTCVYITFLRDPLDRILSTYYFIRSRPQNKLHDNVRKMSFEQFVKSANPHIQPLVRNHQTRIISGRQTPNLSVALHNIDRHFAVVGLTEMYPESVFMMGKMLGWKDLSYTKQNVTKSRPKNPYVPKYIKAWIHKNNALDYQLHALAKQRLVKQIQNLTPQDKRQLALYKERRID